MSSIHTQTERKNYLNIKRIDFFSTNQKQKSNHETHEPKRIRRHEIHNHNHIWLYSQSKTYFFSLPKNHHFYLMVLFCSLNRMFWFSFFLTHSLTHSDLILKHLNNNHICIYIPNTTTTFDDGSTNSFEMRIIIIWYPYFDDFVQNILILECFFFLISLTISMRNGQGVRNLSVFV